MPQWEQLGSEVMLGGYVLPDWVRARELQKLVPDKLQQTIVGRAELSEFSAKLLWLKTQMEYAQGPRPNKDTDVHMWAVAKEDGGPELSLL